MVIVNILTIIRGFMYGVIAGTTLSTIASAAIPVMLRFGSGGHENFFKTPLIGSVNWGHAVLSVAAIGQGITGWYATQYLDENHYTGDQHGYIAAGEAVAAVALYTSPVFMNPGDSLLPTIDNMFENHHGLTEMLLKLALGKCIDFSGNGLFESFAIVNVELTDWSTYIMPLSGAAYHLGKIIFPENENPDAIVSEDSYEDEFEEPIITSPTSNNRVVKAKTATQAKAPNFYLNIQNCNNCTFVTSNENKVEGFVMTKEALLEMATQIAANITSNISGESGAMLNNGTETVET